MSDLKDNAINVYIIAGEASGDLLGAHLMRALKAESPRPVRFYGVGGERMSQEGLNSLFPYQELSLFGFLEVLPAAYNIFARINLTVEDIITKHPDIVITIDVPGFCLRVVERLRKEKLPCKFVHYVAPTVWAYNPKRAETCAKIFDHLLTLLPFEPPYFEKHGLATTFVGHPVVAEITPGNAQAFREKYQIAPDTTLFCILPGSRKGEVQRHMPIFARAIGMLATQYPKLALAVAVPPRMLPFIAPYFEGCPFRAVVTTNEQDKKDAIAAANVAIVKSGTVALEVAQAGTPMLVTYRINPLSAWSMKRISLTKYVNLINILLGREAIPELLQELCHPLIIATAAAHMLQYPGQRQVQQNSIQSALRQLHPNPTQRPSTLAARAILKLLSTP